MAQSSETGGDVSGTSIFFVLEQLDVAAAMTVSGQLETGTESLTADAQATITVDTTALSNVFTFQTDSSSIDDVAATDILYQHQDSSWSSVAFTDSLITASTYPTVAGTGDKVKHDFIRHIANGLFNTHLGVDLLSNEAELVEDLSTNVDASLNEAIVTLLQANSGAYDNTDSSYNFGRSLFLQLNSSSVGRDRLSPITASADYQPFPFVAGDQIQMRVRINAATGQHNLTSASAISERSYLIKLVLA